MRFAGRLIRYAGWLALWLVPAMVAGAVETNAVLASAPTPPSALPSLKSPVAFVRELLAMTPAERKQSLSNRPPEIQARILAKLREYQSLKPDERELRLRATELQWYLLPLMNLPPAERAPRLERIPAELRGLVEDRLARWDQVPAALQEDLLNNDLTARYFTQLKTASADEKQKVLGRISPERRRKLEAGMDRWRDLTEDQRAKTLEGFNAFFELTPHEKEQALGTLSESEQRQMEKTLSAYANLSDDQRVQCMRSFEKFAGMKLADRQAFLKNAERWKLMSPSEREAWRELVNVAPMMPPNSSSRGLLPPVQMHSVPPTLHHPAQVVTNTN